jgi:hypothetical protein
MVAIVIPVYKESFTESEIIGIRQCVKIFGDHPIIAAIPKALNIEALRDISDKIAYQNFPPRFFASVEGYNKLLVNPRFYGAFLKYRYILIYQLDAFVFNKELDAWCAKGLDYIGAPWIHSSWPEQFRSELSFSKIKALAFIKKVIDFDGRTNAPLVGNGGLSLRKTRKFFFLSFLLMLIIKVFRYDWNEDAAWSLFIPKYIPFFRVANFEEALPFAFEVDPEYCYEMNNFRLPFGCHAWEKNNKGFWKPFIEKEGFEL